MWELFHNKHIQVYWIWELFYKQTNTNVLSVGTVSETNRYKRIECGSCLETNKYKYVECGNFFGTNTSVLSVGTV